MHAPVDARFGSLNSCLELLPKLNVVDAESSLEEWLSVLVSGVICVIFLAMASMFYSFVIPLTQWFSKCGPAKRGTV